MKRRVFVLGLVCVALAAGLFLGGCDLFGDDVTDGSSGAYTYTFINTSSYTIYIDSDAWEDFSISPKKTVTKRSNNPSVYITASSSAPAGSIDYTKNTSYTITFYDA
jgi:hypothetical protein